MNFIYLILGVHVLIKAEFVFIIKLICCDECNHFHFLFVHGWSFAFNKILKLYDLFPAQIIYWGKADDRNCKYGHPKMADVESGKNLFCRINCFCNVF